MHKLRGIMVHKQNDSFPLPFFFFLIGSTDSKTKTSTFLQVHSKHIDSCSYKPDLTTVLKTDL